MLQSKITKKDLSRGKLLLKKFCVQFEELYGARYETYNVHCLLHLAQKVEDFGPLWCHSCFLYENLNGDLRALFHGSHKVEIQIATAVVIHECLPNLVRQIPKDSEAEMLFLKMCNRKTASNRHHIFEDMYAVREFVECNLSPSTKTLVEDYTGPLSKAYMFLRFLSCRTMYLSKLYKHATKRNSYTVNYTSAGISQVGQVQYFLKANLHLSTETKYLAVIKLFHQTESNLKLPCHFYHVTESDILHVTDVSNIHEMCYFGELCATGAQFIAKLPGFTETD